MKTLHLVFVMNMFNHLYKKRTKRDVQCSESVSLDEAPSDTQLHHSKHEVIISRHYDIEKKSFLCALHNHDESIHSLIVEWVSDIWQMDTSTFYGKRLYLKRICGL